jgi:hypothetical protein
MSLYFVGDLNILADKRLSSIDCRVYFALVSFMNVKNGKCFPRYATIQKRTGLSKSSIQRSINHLAKLQLVTKKRLSSTNEYLLSRQKILQETIKKRVSGLVDLSDKSNRPVLIKPSYYNYGRRYKNYNRSFSDSGVAKPSLDQTLSYKGETYKKVGEEGHWLEYSNQGRKIRKHKFKNIIEEEKPSKKKFNAAAKAALCA